MTVHAPLLRLILPIPPSVNAAYMNLKHGGRAKTKAYRDWEKLAGQHLIAQQRKFINGTVFVSYTFHFQRDNRRRDCANYEKCLSDFLTANRIIEDDSFILGNCQQFAIESNGRKEVLVDIYQAEKGQAQFYLMSV